MFEDSYCDDPVGEDSSSRSPSKLTLIAGILAFVVLGPTFAANINLGNGTSEFGQGIQLTAACAGNTVLTAKPVAEFTNVANGGSFYVKRVEVSNIPSSCTGVDFTLKLYGDTGTALAIFNENSTEAVIYFDGTNYVKGPGSGYSVSGSGASFSVSFTSPVARASIAKKITLESGGHTVVTCANGGTCSLGDTGPGGGTIFYYSPSPFTMTGAPCGSTCQYLEFAPVSWGNGISVESFEATGTLTQEPSLRWCTGTGYTNALDSAASSGNYQSRSWVLSNTFGMGYQATSRMVGSACTSGAGRVSWDLIFGGQSDWFLPSNSEMNELCKFVKNVSGRGTIGAACASGASGYSFAQTHYWTSTESPETPGQSAWLFFMSSGTNDDDTKNYTGRIRPIRAF